MVIYFLIALCGISYVILAWVLWRPKKPQRPQSVPQRVDEILTRARHHRQTLEALHLELCDLMDCEHNSPGDFLLMQVIWQGADFGEALQEMDSHAYAKKGEPL